MYYCKTCGREFVSPQKIYETHGLSTPPYEHLSICPFCSSNDFKKTAHTHCRCCGARLVNTEKEYCSESCKNKGEKLWKKQIEKFKSQFDNPINKIIREMNDFNLKNNTSYSYGQYVALKFTERKTEKCTKTKSNI